MTWKSWSWLEYPGATLGGISLKEEECELYPSQRYGRILGRRRAWLPHFFWALAWNSIRKVKARPFNTVFERPVSWQGRAPAIVCTWLPKGAELEAGCFVSLRSRAWEGTWIIKNLLLKGTWGPYLISFHLPLPILPLPLLFLGHRDELFCQVAYVVHYCCVIFSQSRCGQLSVAWSLHICEPKSVLSLYKTTVSGI